MMLILDGGIGRHLEALGAPFKQPEWSALALMEKPEFVLQAHQDFIEAGADIITTNSYAVVPFHIGQERFDELGPSLLNKAGKLAHEAKLSSSRRIRIAASIPPMFGSYLPKKFNSEIAPSMLSVFKNNLLPFCDFAVAETMACIEEIQAFIEIFSDCGKPLWISVTLEDNNPDLDNPRLRSGESLQDFFIHINRKKFDALLFNCSQPEVMEPAISLAKNKFLSEKLIGVCANAFPPQKKDLDNANKEVSVVRSELTPEVYQDFASKWLRAGARIIGGCCGIGPHHIKALNQLKSSFFNSQTIK